MSNENSKALIIGAGAERGLGSALAIKFAHNGHQVFVVGRTQEKLDQLVDKIKGTGGNAVAIVCDTTDERAVAALFDQVESNGNGRLDLVIYNAGNSMAGNIRDMDSDYFRQSWEVLCFGGFLVGREVTRRLLPGNTTLIYTGASASLRGKSGFGAFNSGKAALRTLAQAMAKEYGVEGLHVAHIIIDGGILGQRQFDRLGGEPDEANRNRFVSLESLADAYWYLYQQEPVGWTFELDLRTSLESW